jgi:hypothetical protein
MFGCKWLYEDIHCFGRTLPWMSGFHFYSSEWFSFFLGGGGGFAIRFWLYCGRLLHKFHHQQSFLVLSHKTVAISFPTGRQGLFKLSLLVWWMYSPLLSVLLGFNIHKWNPDFSTYYVYDITRSSSPCWIHSQHFVCTYDNFRNPCCSKLVIAYPNCDNLVENSAWNLWKLTWKFWNREVLSFTNFLVNTLKKITHHRWSATLLELKIAAAT